MKAVDIDSQEGWGNGVIAGQTRNFKEFDAFEIIVHLTVEGLGVLQVLDEGGDPVVTGELVEDIRRVE